MDTFRSDHFAQDDLLNTLLQFKIVIFHMAILFHTFSKPGCLSPKKTTHQTTDAGGYMTTWIQEYEMGVSLDQDWTWGVMNSAPPDRALSVLFLKYKIWFNFRLKMLTYTEWMFFETVNGTMHSASAFILGQGRGKKRGSHNVRSSDKCYQIQIKFTGENRTIFRIRYSTISTKNTEAKRIYKLPLIYDIKIKLPNIIKKHPVLKYTKYFENYHYNAACFSSLIHEGKLCLNK